MEKYQTIFLMAGKGTRYQKQYNKVLDQVLNKPLYSYSLKVFLEDERCDKIFLVTNNSDLETLKKTINNDKVNFIVGGKTRQESVKNALKYANLKVLIHDAARPILNNKDVTCLLDALKENDAATFFLPVNDTIRINRKGIYKNIDRNKLIKIYTPQAFNVNTFKTILEAKNLKRYTDEISILLDYDFKIKNVLALHEMPKLTYSSDKEYIEYLLGNNQLTKIGHSFDFHPFVLGNGFSLGGIFIEFDKKLKGWSDGDPLAHSVTEAIIGALGLGDIGKHFPDNDPLYKGINSNYFLEKSKEMLEENGFEIVNIDSIVYLEKPNLKNYKEAMAKNIAEKLGINPESVNVKATTMEQKGLVGKGEGIGAETVVLIRKIN